MVFKDVSVPVEQYFYKLSKFSGKKMVFWVENMHRENRSVVNWVEYQQNSYVEVSVPIPQTVFEPGSL